jgi:predicted dehydrogenase
MKPQVRIGIVGVGAITQLAHLPALSRLRGAEVVALCDNDGPKAAALAERFGVPDVVTDIEDLLELDMDAVIVATPNHLHEPHVLSALRAGVNVLCERPVALTTRGVERILAAAERSGRKLVVGTNHRFRSDVQQLARFLEGGELGQMLAVRAGDYRFRHAAGGWRLSRAEAGGGAFLEQGLAQLDLALWLADFPKIARVTAIADSPRGTSGVEDSMFTHIESAAGLSIVIDTTWNYVGQEERWWFEVLCARGSARLSPLRVVKELNGRPVDVSPTGAAARESAFLQSYRAELAHFVAVVQGESRYEAPADQVLVHRLVEAIYRSADEEKEIRLESR